MADSETHKVIIDGTINLKAYRDAYEAGRELEALLHTFAVKWGDIHFDAEEAIAIKNINAGEK